MSKQKIAPRPFATGAELSRSCCDNVEEAAVERTYDLFERMPNGDVLWRASIPGLAEARKEVAALAERTGNECLLMHVLTHEVIERIAGQQNRNQRGIRSKRLFS
jgi:hypothetical protein